jgi:hypothetical protein
MTSRDIAKVVRYWREAAEHDFETARSLFRTGKYDYCLFLCHLSLEANRAYAKKHLDVTKEMWTWLRGQLEA